jgi:CRISPR/Cas system-associated exonuclease Cas4 (RecB family)
VDPQPLVVVKDERVFNGLARYCVGNKEDKSLSPSALNDYLECRLRFYFKYIARIREANEIEEDLDARVLGNFLHRVMESFYLSILERKKSAIIEHGDFEKIDSIDHFIDQAFIKNYSLDPNKVVIYEGQRLVVKEVVKRFVDRILEMDKAYAPFTIEALERRDIQYNIRLQAEGNPVVVLGGSIDRADRKEDVVRVIDYKTGKDELTFQDVTSLFNREGKRNKAAFQTMLYTLLYQKKFKPAAGRIVPGLMNRINLFNEDFEFGLKQNGNYLTDATPLLPDFEKFVTDVLNELYDPNVPFDQTPQEENCKFCSYKRICYK